MSILETRALVKRYSSRVCPLNGLDLEIQPGEWISLTGVSGSGKTTLLNLLAGLDTPTSGQVNVLGRDLARLSRGELTEFRREQVGLVFQQFHLLPYLTALENVMLAQHYHSLADARSATDALVHVGLGERLDHRPEALSIGERQRVCIARALVNDPKLVLADEPTGNLDDVNARIVMGLFGALHRSGHTLVVVTHDDLFARMADRVFRLEDGKLLEVPRKVDERDWVEEEILHEIWSCTEKGISTTLEAMNLAHHVESLQAMDTLAATGQITVTGALLRLTRAGLPRARAAVRRHRIVERLFSDTFQVDGEEVHELAERFHALMPYGSVGPICSYLGHPKTCPHGHVIPPGDCCSDASDRETRLPQLV